MITKTQLKALRSRLPKNYHELIAEKSKLSESMVRKVLFGYRENETILDIAIEMAEEATQKNLNRKKRVKSIISEKLPNQHEKFI